MASIETATTKSGHRRYRVRYRDPSGQSREKWFDRKQDATRFLHGVEHDITRGEFIDPGLSKTTVGEYWSDWWATRVNLRPSTLATQESLSRNHLLPELGGYPLGAIRASDIKRWVAELQTRGLSPSTIRALHGLLSGLMNSAAEDRYIPRSPIGKSNLPTIESTPMRLLDHGEVEELASTIQAPYRAMTILAAYTGLRWGEAAGLRDSTINLLSRSLEVVQTVNEVKGKIIIGPPKTRASQRRLTLPRFVSRELERHLAEHGVGDAGFLFKSPEGGPLRRTHWRRRVWKPAVASSIGEPCRFHTLRHSHAAMLIAEGQHPKVIQERLGHQSIRTTLDVYGHLFTGLDEAAADALDAAYADGLWGSRGVESPVTSVEGG